MGTILRNSDWEKSKQVQKGNIGERVVQQFLESKDFVCYQAVTEKAHPFDFLAVKDKTLAIAAEVKTKSLMTYYQATGFNYRSFLYYNEFSKKHNMHIFIFFVDESLKQVYGNWLSQLEIPCNINGVVYPRNITTRQGRVIRLYPYCKMRIIAKLEDDISEQLKQLSARNYEYPIK